ncbi:MAG: UvrD-helicase domain-containing protein [Alphaproteobacteria bacterium]|nr:UvrD-helicase domain-containing protein [Alphaproteobacteria bacterium]MBV8548050.1 UvrD-helicase domain-containing protein [Alphaproteobacteria bacterium]
MQAMMIPENDIQSPAYQSGLNDAQRQAVDALDGPVLVLAGAGTGKTRVLTTRLVHLLMSGKAVPGQILAVTFTNKAAAEIRERISHMLGRSVEGWHLGTFHALATRLLRPYAERVGLRPNFTILDEDDQSRLIKQLLAAENVDDKKSPARVVLAVISRWKDRGLGPDDIKGDAGGLANGKMPKLYAQYQERLRELNACDFGDLLLHHLTLLRNNPDILAALHERFKYILVDEYQDTNVVQYLWLRLLAQGNNNICCVGDEDQSIYGWRGAEIGNILRFEEDFPGAKVVRLEQNYRSTGHILGAASHLIANNSMRLGKNLWTAAEPGERVRVMTLWDGDEEARWVGDEIEALQRRGVSLGQMAVMVRAGFQTRKFEERFITLGIPYRVLVGARFYERAEIRDALAYLRLLHAPEDDLAFERIINTPKRGVGPAAMQQLHHTARSLKIPLTQATQRLAETDELKPKLRATLRDLMVQFDRWRTLLQTLPHGEVTQIMLDESGYTGMWQADKSPEAPGRLDNLKELVTAMAEFDTLPAFLEHVSLVLEATDKSGEAQVSLMTLHGAKGLEFDHVFLPGWEEEIFPSRLALEENGAKGLEEERRLAYVGITRARQRAFISHVANRHMHGSWINALPSRFLAELPAAHVERQSAIGNASVTQRWNNSGFSSRNEDDDYRGKAPSLFQQIRTQQSSARGYSQQRPQQIEGRATVIQRPRNEDGFNVGDRVFHDKFGNGTIRRIDHDKLEIAFDKAGLKKVMAGFVRRS